MSGDTPPLQATPRPVSVLLRRPGPRRAESTADPEATWSLPESTT